MLKGTKKYGQKPGQKFFRAVVCKEDQQVRTCKKPLTYEAL